MSRIDQMQRAAAADPLIIGFAGGLPAEAQFPKRELALAFLRALRKTGTPALQYGWAEGSEKLREWVAARLRGRGAAVKRDDVIITSGAQQAIAIALELVARPGDRIAVGAATYPAALELMRARRLIPVSQGARIRAHYVMPAIGNPRGDTFAEETRRALLSTHAAIIEDDAYADLSFDGRAHRPLLADAPERVYHVGTFSKILSPGLRIGWLVLPPRLRSRALRVKQGNDLQASSLAQAIVEDYLFDGPRPGDATFDARLRRLRRFYRAKAHAMARSIRAHLPDWRFSEPQGGFAIWAELDQRGRKIDEIQLLKAAIAERVVFDPGSLFRAGGHSQPLALRLCFSAVSGADIDVGIRRLSRAYRRLRK